MQAVKISSKFQIVIPKDVREPLGIEAGQKFQIIRYKDRIELIPMKSIKSMKGFLKGIDTTIAREDDRV